MNKYVIKIKLLFALVLVLIPLNLNSSLDQLGKLLHLDQINLDKLTSNKTFATQIDKEIESLKKIRSDQYDFFNLRKPEIENLKTEIEQFKEKSKDKLEEQDEFSTNYLMILNQSAQVLSELSHSYQQIINFINTNIKTLQEFKTDPEFKSKVLRIAYKSIYSIEDIQKLSDLMLQYDKKIVTAEEKIKKSSVDLDQLKKSLNLAKQEYEDKKKEQKEFNPEEQADNKLTVSQRATLLDEEEKLLYHKKNLAEFKVKEIEQKKQLFETDLRIIRIQLEIIINEYEKVKNDLCVDESDVKRYAEVLNKQVQETSQYQNEITKKISDLDRLKYLQQKEIVELKKKYRLSDDKISLIKEWALVPHKFENWLYLINIGKMSNYLSYDLNIGTDELLAQLDNEKSKEIDKKVESLIVNTWHKITTGKLNNLSQEDLITREIKNYEKEKTDLTASMSTTSDKQSEIISALNLNNTIIENIKLRMEDLKDQKDKVFKHKPTEYSDFLNQLKIEGFDNGPKRNESIAHLIEVYNNINNLKKLTIKKIDIIIEELKTRVKLIGIPILIQGVKNFVPDIKQFFLFLYNKDVKDIITANKKNCQYLFNYYKTHPANLAIVLFNIIIILLVFLFLKIYREKIIHILGLISPKYGVGLTVSSFLITTFKFITNYLGFIFSWLLLLFAIKYKFIVDNYTIIIFYLFSIPAWLAIIYKYIQFLSEQNIDNNYFLISKEYQRRFLTVLSIALYASTTILLLKEGFMLSPIAKSNVTITLQALQFIILQIGLIFILSKEQILNLIPKSNNFWQWIYDQAENYYYLFLSGLILVIIMSNPYLGYGRQFFYFVSRFVLILFLIPIVTAIHNRIKRSLTTVLFNSTNDGLKERFSYAKTVYGILVIFTFIFFIALAAVIAANILGYKIGFSDINDLINKEIYSVTDLNKGRPVPINSLNFVRVAFWVLGGTICAYIINRFILNKVFDLLLVNIGIQNAVISLVRYTIIMSAFIIGLKSEYLGSVINYILVIIGAFGFAAKEIVTDLIGYFIILIQRPIKIGDFIRITEDINGIVRHITLRSVILRRKNSVTIIVPNSQIMSNPVVNWNYSRSYFAFDDILVIVPYSADPEKVRDLLFKVIDSNINILKNPVPIVWLHNFTENGYQFLVRGYISFDRVLEQWDIASNVRLTLVKVLRNNGIQIASPVRFLKILDSNTNTKEQ